MISTLAALLVIRTYVHALVAWWGGCIWCVFGLNILDGEVSSLAINFKALLCDFTNLCDLEFLAVSNLRHLRKYCERVQHPDRYLLSKRSHSKEVLFSIISLQKRERTYVRMNSASLFNLLKRT